MPGYSGQGPAPPPPVEMARGRDYDGDQYKDFSDKNRNREQIINQTPPPVPGGYFNGNFANFNLGHPLTSPQLPTLVRIPKSPKKGVSIPLMIGGGGPFYAQSFPNYAQFQGRGVTRQF